MCIFKELQRDQDQTVHDEQEHTEHMPTVSEEQFYKLYEVKDLRWQTVRIQQVWQRVLYDTPVVSQKRAHAKNLL